MKVTFVLPGYARKPIGGIRVVYTYANRLVDLGHDVTVLHTAMFRTLPDFRAGRPRAQTREIAGGIRDLARGAPTEVVWHDIDPAIEMRYVSTISEKSVPDSDAVVATAWQTADPVARLGPRKGRPCYLVQHHETWSGRAERVDETWRLPLRVIVTARWLEARANKLGVKELWRIPYGMDTAKFSVLRQISPRPKRVAMMYSSWAWKGAADGMAALVAARTSVADLEAVVFGTDPRPRDLPHWIEYVCDPEQDDLVRDVYNGSSVYLCPSHSEGWGLPSAEAMACGTAVVTTDNGGSDEFCSHDVNALLSPPRDVDSLAKNLVAVLTNEELHSRLAHAGHASIQEFSWERSTRELESVLFEPALAAR